MIYPYEKMMNILMILEVLKKNSDAEHPIARQTDIAELVEKEYGVKIDRHAIRRNLDNLEIFLKYAQSGYSLSNTGNTRESTKERDDDEVVYSNWYLEHDITDAELHFLIDGLIFSKHIPYNLCNELVKKLENLTSKYFKHKLDLPENKSDNKQLFCIIEVLNEAIAQKCKVSFRFITIEIDLEMHVTPGKDGELRKVSPYETVMSNGMYYLICAHDGSEQPFSYRIDCICDIKILTKERSRPIEEISGLSHNFNLLKYAAEHIYFYSGNSIRVTFRADMIANKAIITHITDRFGMNIRLEKETEDSVLVTVTVNEQAMLYWALQFGMSVEILNPPELRKKVRDAIHDMWKKYE